MSNKRKLESSDGVQSSNRGNKRYHVVENTIDLERCQEIIKSGDIDEMNRLSYLLSQGKGGILENIEITIHQLEEAVELGDTEAMNELGKIFERLTRDGGKRAIELYKRAIGLGNQNAINNLAVYYMYGSGHSKQLQKASVILQKGIDMGNTTSMNHQSDMYLNLLIMDKCHIKKAMKLKEKASTMGNGTATYDLAKIYMYGECGHEINVTKAIEFYTKGTELNHPRAMYKLGKIYKEGKYGTRIDMIKAKDLFIKAAHLGQSVDPLVQIYIKEENYDTAAHHRFKWWVRHGYLQLKGEYRYYMRYFLFDHKINWIPEYHIHWPFENKESIDKRILTLLLLSKHRMSALIKYSTFVTHRGALVRDVCTSMTCRGVLVRGVIMIIIKYLCHSEGTKKEETKKEEDIEIKCAQIEDMDYEFEDINDNFADEDFF